MTTGAGVDGVVGAANETIEFFASGRFGALGGDPCAEQVQLREWEQTQYRPAAARLNGAAAAVSGTVIRGIEDSISTRGHSGRNGTALEVWLNNHIGTASLTPTHEEVGTAVVGVLSSGASVPAAAIATLRKIRDRLPTVAEIRAGVSTVERGLEVGPQIYLYKAGIPNPTTEAEKRKSREGGRFVGPRISEEVDNWMVRQMDRVTPSSFPDARQRLERLVGTSAGSGAWGIWVPGDPISAGSKIGEMEAMRGDIRARLDDLDDRCQAQLAEHASLTRQQQESDIAFRRNALVAGASVALFTVIALARRR